MAMMDINHPDIEEFISSKDFLASLKKNHPENLIPDNLVEEIIRNVAEALDSAIPQTELINLILSDIRSQLFEPLSNMNISVAVTDNFMRSVIDDKEFTLDACFPVKKVSAKELFHKIAQSAWRTADPGSGSSTGPMNSTRYPVWEKYFQQIHAVNRAFIIIQAVI